MKALALALTMLGAWTGVALAGDKLVLRDQLAADGSPAVVEGDVVELTDSAVRVRTGAGELVLLGFEALAPASLHRLLLERTDRADPDARLRLAERLQRFGAYDEARAELVAVLELDATREEPVAARRRALDDAQAQDLYNRGLELMLERKWMPALDAFRTIADRFAETRWAEKAIERSERAVAGLEADEGDATPGGAAGAPARRLTPAEKAAARKQALIAHCQAEAAKAVTLAEEKNREGLKLDGEGQVSAAKNAYEAALVADARAKGFLGRRNGLQKLATDLKLLEDAQKRIESINTHLVLVHLNLASLLMSQRNFKGAREQVDFALRIDPMNKRALELKAEIAKHSITRKVSDMTNAKPTVTGGGR